MITLTFAEQVKIVLKRKGMTIKQLAEEIEIRTGMKMSRQNLTQRLGRDNFQEKDMRMIADILECPFQLNILEVEEDAIPVEEVTVKKTVEPKTDGTKKKVVKRVVTEIVEEVKDDTNYQKSTWPARDAERESKANTAQTVKSRDLTMGEVAINMDEAPDKKQGDINPYTGYEHKTNTVRSHPKRIGYVQVYDRATHQWSDMTEWAFLGYQEQLRLEKGKAYEEPTYLD